MRLILISVIFLLCMSCINEATLQEEIIVISEVFKSIPTEITSPPFDENLKFVDSSQQKILNFKYAVNSKFIELSVKPSNSFQIVNKNNAVKKEVMDSSKMGIINDLLLIKTHGNIDQSSLNNLLKNSLIYLDKRIINKEDKDEYKIDGIISFTRVAFDEAIRKAAIGVSIYREGLDSNLTVYILEKENSNWKIMYKQTLEKS